MILGTNWPGVRGIAAGAREVVALCPDEDTAALILAGSAARVYDRKPPGDEPGKRHGVTGKWGD